MKTGQRGIFRSKVRWYEEGERNTKYFYRLEKQCYNYKTMNCIVRPNGSISKHQKEILELQAKFDEKLYTADTKINFSFVSDTQVNLIEEEAMEMGKPLTLDELTCAVKSMKCNKTPGCDGLPMEFYAIFWKCLGPIILEMLKEAHRAR